MQYATPECSACRPAAISLVVLRERWRPQPLIVVQRIEARRLARELGAPLVTFEGAPPCAPALLRMSDAQMLRVAELLTRAGAPYFGPWPQVMQVCYDKLQATRLVETEGIACPRTLLANAASAMAFPLIVKPRRGSDSIGVRLLRNGPIPARYRTADYLAQEHLRGREVTVAVIRGRVGRPLELALPPGAIYTFAHKYLQRPRRPPLAELALAARVREAALKIARLFALNWAARLDFIATPDGRLCFLECDVAPMICAESSFAASMSAAGIERAEQLALLTT